MDCPFCDSLVHSCEPQCRCGYMFHGRVKIKKRSLCCMWPCREPGSHAMEEPDGKLAVFCLKHYDERRPKSDIELEIELRAAKMREEGKTGWQKP